MTHATDPSQPLEQQVNTAIQKASVAMFALIAGATFAQDQKSFTGQGSTRVEACDAAKKMAELFNYRTASCDCSKTSVGSGWVCQVDGKK